MQLKRDLVTPMRIASAPSLFLAGLICGIFLTQDANSQTEHQCPMPREGLGRISVKDFSKVDSRDLSKAIKYAADTAFLCGGLEEVIKSLKDNGFLCAMLRAGPDDRRQFTCRDSVITNFGPNIRVGMKIFSKSGLVFRIEVTTFFEIGKYSSQFQKQIA